jgi:hypothetical protein
MLPLFLSRRYPLVRRFNTGSGLKSLLGNQEGLRCDLPQVAIEIDKGQNLTTTLRFFCDTGADLMVIPVYVARRVGIPFREDHEGTLISTVGGSARCFYDFVQVRSSLSGRTHRWACAFTESLQARLILGRSGFLDDFAVAVTGRHLVVSHPVSLGWFLKHHARRLSNRSRPREKWDPI